MRIHCILLIDTLTLQPANQSVLQVNPTYHCLCKRWPFMSLKCLSSITELTALVPISPLHLKAHHLIFLRTHPVGANSMEIYGNPKGL